MKRLLGSRALFFTVMGVLAAIYTLPLMWMVMSSFKTNSEIFSSPLSLPTSIDFSTWVDAWVVGNLGRYVFNSLFITSLSVLTILVFSALAAYAFSVFDFKGKGILFAMFAIGLLMPIQSYFIAQNSLFELLSIKGHRWTLIVPYAAMGIPLAIYLLKVYLDGVPRQLFDAARIDGASDMRMFSVLVLPMLRPGLATVAVFSILATWNEFLLALLYVTNDAYKTIPTGLLAFSSRYVTDYQLLFSALTIVTLPMIVIYVIFHRQVIAGITDGSLK